MTARGEVLVTRPEPGLAETMRALADLGYRPVAAPLLIVRTRPLLLSRPVQAVLLTSGQAIGPLCGHRAALRDCAVLAVGDSTAVRARAAGFGRVDSAAGTASQLAELAIASLRPQDGPLLLACGLGQGAPLALRLREAGFRVVRRCVYEALPVPAMPGSAIRAIEAGRVEAALFFSRDTAATFARLLPDRLRPALADVRALAISAPTAVPLRALPWRRVVAAPVPDAASVLSLLDAA